MESTTGCRCVLPIDFDVKFSIYLCKIYIYIDWIDLVLKN